MSKEGRVCFVAAVSKIADEQILPLVQIPPIPVLRGIAVTPTSYISGHRTVVFFLSDFVRRKSSSVRGMCFEKPVKVG